MAKNQDEPQEREPADGETLADEVERLSKLEPPAGDGRGEPGDGSAGASGPGGSSG